MTVEPSDVGLGSVLLGILAVITLAAKAYIRRSAQSEKNHVKTQDELRAALAASDARCQEQNADLTGRIRALEERAHNEGRQDRDRLLEIIRENAEASRLRADADRGLARAMDKVADRIERTPPAGLKAQL